MLLFTNDVLEMAVAKSKGKGTIKYWNNHTFSKENYDTLIYIEEMRIKKATCRHLLNK